jgi:predicted  nucleic acid-binding Zn-ribbon protein
MSTLVAQTISNGTVSTSSANVIQGSAKAWVNYKGTSTQSIRASYNVSSVTVNTTGQYTINFTNAFADTNYVLAEMGYNTSSVISNTYYDALNGTKTTTSIRISSINHVSNSYYDSPEMYIAVFA